MQNYASGYLPNNDPNLRIISAALLEDGTLLYDVQPLVGYVIESGYVAEAIGLELPCGNEERAVVDMARGAWWTLGDGAGEGLDAAKAHLAELLVAAPQPAGADVPLTVAA